MLKLGEWPLLAIALSIYLIIFALVLLGVKGTELCHRQKKMGIFFMFISLNIIGLFWANKIFKKENPDFKFWKTIKNIFKIKRKNKKIAV